MAPKKAALKEAEAELAVAMEVSFFHSCSQVFILFLTYCCADFPHNSIGVEKRAHFECCTIFMAKRDKGNEK